MSPELARKVEELEKKAPQVRDHLSLGSRAFVMEFSGTPKSGKSTSVEAIRHFFSRNGFGVHVLAERAAVCPIPMKGHLFFNTWCTASMLAELLANVETQTDIIIIDRGILDALVWLTLQERRGELTDEEARIIESFVLLDRWRTLVDLSVVMTVTAKEALHREHSHRISSKTGSIMNEDVLNAITQSVDIAITRYGGSFRKVIRHDTTERKVKESNVDLAGEVLTDLEQFLNPEILVVPAAQMNGLHSQAGGEFGPDAVSQALECIQENVIYLPRAQVEPTSDYVQIIPCGILRYKDQVFVFRRKETDPKYRLYGKATIWKGCHVPRGIDAHVGGLLEKALQERISRSLFLSRIFNASCIGYCWDRDDTHTNRHFGVVYWIDIDNPHTAQDLRKKEFRNQRGHGLTGQFHSLEYLDAEIGNIGLESWSRAIIRYLCESK